MFEVFWLVYDSEYIIGIDEYVLGFAIYTIPNPLRRSKSNIILSYEIYNIYNVICTYDKNSINKSLKLVFIFVSVWSKEHNLFFSVIQK